MKAVAMDKNSWENDLIRYVLLIFFSATTSATVSKEDRGTRIRNFLGGCSGGFVAMIICRSTDWSDTTKLIVCFVVSSFVTSIWPKLGDIANRYLKKKGDDISGD